MAFEKKDWIIMQSTVRNTTDKIKENPKDERKIKKTIDEEVEKLKKAAYSNSTPRNYIQKSTTADIYAQKKISTSTQSNKASKKAPGSTNPSNSVLLKSSPSSVSQRSTRSSHDKKPNLKTVEAKTSLHSARINTQKSKDPATKTSVDSVRRTAKDMPVAKAPVDSTRRAAKDPKVSVDSARRIAKDTPVAKATIDSARKNTLPQTNVTINSPAAKRKLKLEEEQRNSKEIAVKSVEKGDSMVEKAKKDGSKEMESRQRTKTRTLDDDEVKVLTPNVVENNTEMMNLSRKLAARPKAFFVDIDGDQPKHTKQKSSDEDFSYEDDFESYESDFESYHSEQSGSSDQEDHSSSQHEHNDSEGNGRGGKDEENMLDSGSFDLRETQRSANKTKPVAMDNILEDAEDASDKKQSLTDEGFQEMSTAIAVSTVRPVHVDVLDKPLFIDFTKSKENKRKRRMSEQLKQRARDLLSMITLHEMSYSLLEMKPIPYDLYMATFGRSNYTQIAVQTFDDGITEETQTEEVQYDCKWTQHPVKFSNHDIYLKSECVSKKNNVNDEDYLAKFTFLVNRNSDVYENNKINTDKDYKRNPLRLYFEQKDGAGSCEMLPYENYISKIKNNGFNMTKLNNFLKKVESRVSRVLNMNAGNANMSNLVHNPKLPFSKGYLSICTKNIKDETLSFLKFAKITGLVFSESKTNLIMTIHKKPSSGIAAEKNILCLWDINVARKEPVKVLVAIDNITVGRFRGNTDGIFVAALEDGSIHLWDLSEEPTWREDVASEHRATNLVEINSDRMTQTEIDREWNLQNSNVVYKQPTPQCALQACAYTSSAANLSDNDVTDCVVGLEFVGEARAHGSQDGGRKVAGQVCSLQRVGILTIYSIIQDKSKTTSHDTGKAFWSKMKLEKTHKISLIDHFDVQNPLESDILTNFNLNAAKRRLSGRKQEKSLTRKDSSRPKSAISSDFEFDIDRPASATSLKNKRVLSVEKKATQSWENGIVCCDLKILTLNKVDEYLVAKNCGEVLCCTRNAGVFKINKFCVATDTSSVTCLDVSPHGLPYFLAATDSGTVNLCSLVDARVLLTLDCRNGPPFDSIDKCHSDNKGRYISSTSVSSHAHTHLSETRTGNKLSIRSVHWSRGNPCCIYTALGDGSLAVWELTHSDICARHACAGAAVACAHADGTLALLTPDGEVQVHRVADDDRNNHHLDLFRKYATLL